MFSFLTRLFRPRATPNTIVSEGVTRQFWLYVPRVIAQPAPVILAFHGGGGDSEAMVGDKGWEDVAEGAGAIFIAPVGYMGEGWNTRLGFPGASTRHGFDDVAFVRAIVDAVAAQYPIDRSRVYAAGFSAGAIMCYRLAAEASDMIAAFAALNNSIGHIGEGEPTIILDPATFSARPVSAFLIHGGADNWRGGPPRKGAKNKHEGQATLPFMDGVELWKRTDGATQPGRCNFPVPVELCERWTNPSTGVTVLAVVDKHRGHWWPRTWPAAEIIWRFFESVPPRT
jgi:polyhydroxybutyrate depolymerase